MMKRFLILFAVFGLTLTLAVAGASPARAAKNGKGGSPQSSIQMVEGTASGTTMYTVSPGDPFPLFSPIEGNFGVRASTLGRGTLTFEIPWPPASGLSSPGLWTFVASDGKSYLTGTGYFDSQPGVLDAVLHVSVGTGKFLGVSGGQLTVHFVFDTPGDFGSVGPHVGAWDRAPIYGHLTYG